MLQNGFCAKLCKTDRIDVDDKSHLLPPFKGYFAEFLVSEYFCPDEWSKDGVFVKVEENEPLWIDLRGNDECACIPSIQRLNPVTGDPADLHSGLAKDPKQNYLKLPDQLWLDGYARDGKVYQFIITKAGAGLAVSEFVLPKHMQDSHAIGFAFFGCKNPKPAQTLTQRYDLSGMFTTDNTWYSKSQKLSRISTQSTGVLRSVSNTSVPISSSGDHIFVNHTEVRANYASLDTIAMDTSHGFATAEPVDMLEQPEPIYDKASMGAGGRIVQRIVPDNNTIEYYHEKPSAILTIYLALPEQFDSIMKNGKRQQSHKKDEYTYSGKIGGVQVPLLKPSA